MARNKPLYNPAELEQQALNAIETNGLVFVDEVCHYLPCARSTFYELQLDKSDRLKNALLKNRVEKKGAMRNKWEKSENATLQMGLYKLLATPEELAALSMQHVDHTTKGSAMPVTIIEFVNSDSIDPDKD